MARNSAWSLAMNLGMARATPRPASRQAIADATKKALLALTELREFIRGCTRRPQRQRLDATLSGVARTSAPVRLQVDVDHEVLGEHRGRGVLHRLEALTNVAKYAQAASAEVTSRIVDVLRIVVRDDGAIAQSSQLHRPWRCGPGSGTGLRPDATCGGRRDTHHRHPPGGPTTVTAGCHAIVIAGVSMLLRAGSGQLLTDGAFDVVAVRRQRRGLRRRL